MSFPVFKTSVCSLNIPVLFVTLRSVLSIKTMRRNKINWRVPKGAELTELDKRYYIGKNGGI